MAYEKRLVDANALKDALRTKEGAKVLGHSVHRRFCMDKIIDAQQKVDAVEVVRCKDCKHWKPCAFTGGECSLDEQVWCDDDFCSYGERKGNE